jgi:formylglycine-generating enzyme required for sulfatase activity
MKKILFITLAFICASAAYGQRNGSVYNPDGIEMVYVEGNDDIEGFYIGKYEITQAQYQAIMGVNPSYYKGSDYPVENVSWEDVQKFISKLNARTDRKYRLPHDKEWKYAAHDGNNYNTYKYSGG